MKRWLLICCFLFSTVLCTAQIPACSVSGKVTDAETAQPLWGAMVSVSGNQPSAPVLTDSTGKFMVSGLIPGRINIKISYIGFDPVVKEGLMLNSGKELQLNFTLSESVTAMQEVEIVAQKDKTRANNDFAAVSARSFSMEDTRRYAATLNDPARMVQSFAGVASAGDDNNAIVVRGNSPQGMLWRLEGLEIPNPNHFAGSEGSTGGGVSILSSNMLGSTDFYSGAFPAEFGNAQSGVFDLNLRKGNDEKRHYAFQAGVLGLEASAEGPFKKGKAATYLVNYRYSTLDILSLMGFKIGGTVIPKYQDLAFHFYLPTPRSGTFTLYGIGGLSSLGSRAERDSSSWSTSEDREDFKQFYRMGVIGATHLYPLRNKLTYLKSSLAFNYSENGFQLDTLNQAYEAGLRVNEKYRYFNVRAGIQMNHKFNAANSLRAGVLFTATAFQIQKNDPRAAAYFGNKSQTVPFLSQLFWQWKLKRNHGVEWISGMHFTYSSINRKFYVEPRIAFSWKPHPAHRISAAVGLHNRSASVSLYTMQFTDSNGIKQYPNRGLDFSRSFQWVVGYDYTFLKEFRLRTEWYVQYLFGVPAGSGNESWYAVMNVADGLEPFRLGNTAKGLNYGVEITFEKFFSKHYYFMFTTSLFQSKYQNGNSGWKSTAYDMNYVMNLLGGKEFVVGKKKINLLGINLKLLWRGGNREIPVLEEASRQKGETVYDYSNIYRNRLPDYFRIDFGLNFRRNKKKYNWLISFDAQNIINRQNVAGRTFNPISGAVETRKNLGIIPVLSYKIEF